MHSFHKNKKNKVEKKTLKNHYSERKVIKIRIFTLKIKCIKRVEQVCCKLTQQHCRDDGRSRDTSVSQ